jgi:hypothetical protein
MERHHVQEEKAEKSHQAEQGQDQQAGICAEETEEKAQEGVSRATAKRATRARFFVWSRFR